MKLSTRNSQFVFAAFAAFAMILSSAMASADVKPTDWIAKDVKGRSVDTSKYRGKVMMVFINSAETKDRMKTISKKLTLKYGKNKKVAQLTVVDLTDAPLTWLAAEKAAGEVTKRTAKAHDRTVKRMNTWLTDAGKKPIKRLDKKLHIVLDWKGKVVKNYDYFDSEKHVTIVVINQHGDPIASFKGTQLTKAMAAVDAAVAEIE